MPRVMGILTHLDVFKKAKQIRKVLFSFLFGLSLDNSLVPISYVSILNNRQKRSWNIAFGQRFILARSSSIFLESYMAATKRFISPPFHHSLSLFYWYFSSFREKSWILLASFPSWNSARWSGRFALKIFSQNFLSFFLLFLTRTHIGVFLQYFSNPRILIPIF